MLWEALGQGNTRLGMFSVVFDGSDGFVMNGKRYRRLLTRWP